MAGAAAGVRTSAGDGSALGRPENWCHDAKGRRLVTDILPLERLEDELPPLLASVGIPRTEPLPVLNARSAIDWPLWYNGNSRALVAQRYAWDIENFRYS